MCCNKNNLLTAGAFIGGLLAILGGILIPVGNSIIEDNVKKEAIIENGTVAYENWVLPGTPVYRQFWLFNVNNPLEIAHNGSKPILRQKGPYTYRVRYLPKINITVNLNNTISFLQPYGAYFEPGLSVGTEEDNITFLNLAVAGAPSVLPALLLPLLNNLIKQTNSSLFQTRTVKEMLWGYEDPILKALKLADAYTGVFYPYNGTADGYYNIFNGRGNIEKLGIIDKWQGEGKLTTWKDPYCNMINGTDGSVFPPFIDKRKVLDFFSSDICRSVVAEYESSRVLKGIPVYRFMLPPKTFASPVDNPENRCYCTDTQITRNCTTAGILDISGCKEGMPIFISLPHFLYGSEDLQESIDGLKPNDEEHSTFLDVEPVTGVSLNVAKRLQVNILIQPSNKIEVLSNIKKHIFFPIVWLNETATVDDATAEKLKGALISTMELLETIQLTLIGCGCVIFLACIITLCVLKKRKTKNHS
ncbi:platelet glycoprotein 4 isoform X2 [Polyodon spathula]|uniref:platelet glycoprotein 4 isoform X2 n=1 Tax=Polyodon spathula TaxID=7913 RepID=UPI001B7F289B|nr:platelet glycoprotein 4 isoform X2 [Polyodon spathula]